MRALAGAGSWGLLSSEPPGPRAGRLRVLMAGGLEDGSTPVLRAPSTILSSVLRRPSSILAMCFSSAWSLVCGRAAAAA